MNKTELESGKGKRSGFVSGSIVGGVIGALLMMVVNVTAFPGGPKAMMGQGVKGHFGGARDGMMLDFVLTKIDATDSQRAQIEQIVSEAKAEMAANRPEREAIKTQLKAIFLQPQVDRAALEEMRLAMLQKAETGSARAVQAMGDVSDVLTQEQRVQLFELHENYRH